jgi:hypothetical protein
MYGQSANTGIVWPGSVNSGNNADLAFETVGSGGSSDRKQNEMVGGQWVLL